MKDISGSTCRNNYTGLKPRPDCVTKIFTMITTTIKISINIVMLTILAVASLKLH